MYRIATLKIIIALTAALLGGIAHGEESCVGPQVGGIYQSSMKFMSLPDGRKVPAGYTYLRFLPEGNVITVASLGTPDEVKHWFNASYPSAHPVPYKLEGRTLSFTDQLRKGSIEYVGELVGCALNLNTHSTITGHDDQLIFLYKPD